MKFYVVLTEEVKYTAEVFADSYEEAEQLAMDNVGEPLESTYETQNIVVHEVYRP